MPNSTIMTSMPRLGGDGMDIDLLRKQENTPPISRSDITNAKDSNQNKKNMVIKNFNVPIYNSKHLHIDTNKTLESLKLKDASYTSDINDVTSKYSEKSININEEKTPVETRQVEGKDPTNMENLESEIKSLKDQLNAQVKVNEDLKRLLVASVGEDLHHSVEALVRTRAQLVVDMDGYDNKIFKEEEEIDKLSIQADMWHSKYMATKVLLDEVTRQRDSSSESWLHCRNALLQLLHVYTEIKENLLEGFQHMRQLKSALGPHYKSKHKAIPGDVMQLSDDVKHYANAIRYSLLGNISSDPLPIDSAHLSDPAEILAYQVIYAMPVCMEQILKPIKTTSSNNWADDEVTLISRFHSSTKYDNITYYCCPNCKGEIQVI